MAIIKVNGATKRGQELLARARNFEGTELRQVYGRWSDDKESAMQRCRRECYEDSGYNFHIIGANGWAFSVAWEYNNTETGEIMTKIKTSRNTYIIDGSRASAEV